MKNRRLLLLALAALALLRPAVTLRGQVYADSAYVRAPVVDSTLVGKDIFTMLRRSGTVQVEQSLRLREAFSAYVARNAEKPLTGYRVRVYFNNVRNARTDSEAVARTVVRDYPWLGVYRSFESPNFKVCVGDFRTKDEALKVWSRLRRQYPEAFIIKETVNYPSMER